MSRRSDSRISWSGGEHRGVKHRGPSMWLRAAVVAAIPVMLIGGVITPASAAGAKGEGPYPWKYPATGTVKLGSGTTIGGTKCTSGAGQFNSTYADPCIAKWSGNNGGATYDGVTATTITLAERTFPQTANSETLAAEAKQEGIAIPQVTDQVAQVFLNYFNKVYDLYGRHVVLQEEHAVGNATAEALGGGQTQACADADTIAKTMHAFGEVGFTLDPNGVGGGGTGPFSVCAAQDGLVEFAGGPYFSEAWFESLNPYVWNITQDCTRIADNEAQIIASYLAGKKAIYAGQASLRSQKRKIATYIPNEPQYISCNGNPNSSMSKLLENKYHLPASTAPDFFTYNLDVSTFPQSAEEAAVKFKADGDTTINLACDPYSASLLMKAAAAQGYFPEWLSDGVALEDTDTVAQTFPATEVQGHLFGVAEAPPQQLLFGPTSEAGKLYQRLTGHQIPPGTDGDFYELVQIFDQLQAAGPDLTPQNMARGTHGLPILGKGSVDGIWDFRTGPTGKANAGDHTAIENDLFVYWNQGGTSPVNQKPGTYVDLFGGTRYSIGQWPSKLPKLFTAAGSAATGSS
jgi:hypothetical protein